VAGAAAGVEVGIEDGLDGEAVGVGVGEVFGDVAAGADDDGPAGGLVGDHVRGLGEAVEVVLGEEHGRVTPMSGSKRWLLQEGPVGQRRPVSMPCQYCATSREFP
jgi:hypothetical protein